MAAPEARCRSSSGGHPSAAPWPSIVASTTSGIAPDTIGVWHEAGAAGYGIGSSIYKPGDTAEIVGRKAAACRAATKG